MKIVKNADAHLQRRFCSIPRCGHSPSAHIKNTMGKFMGERGRCEYSRCPCMGYVPKGWIAPKMSGGGTALLPKNIPGFKR